MLDICSLLVLVVLIDFHRETQNSVNFEEVIETQRLRLFRVVTGLIVLLGVLSLSPISRCFSVSVCQFTASILSRAEAAARYLVIAQARAMLAPSGARVTQSQLSACLDRVFVADENNVSLANSQRRLRVLRAILRNLPRAACRLLHQTAKHLRRTGRERATLPFPEASLRAALRDWQFTSLIERPPDRAKAQAYCGEAESKAALSIFCAA